jgi:alpha-amylase/alpha-mannosidase (GH57 family)
MSPVERFRAWCAALEYSPTQDALALWASKRRGLVPRHVLVYEVDTIARACFPAYAADILGALEACKII